MASDKITIVVLHGWSLSAHNQSKWQPFLDSLTEAKSRVVFLPLPGLSSPITTPWTLEDYVSWLKKELDALESNNLVLIGHSFGGQLAIKFCSLYPNRITNLVLIDSSGIRDYRWHMKLKRLVFRTIAKLGKPFKQLHVMRRFLYVLARERDYEQAYPVLRTTMSNVLNQEIVDDLPKVTVPTLIIWGNDDKTTPLFLGETILGGIKNSQLVIINGARHSPQFTHTKQVIAHITKFLN